MRGFRNLVIERRFRLLLAMVVGAVLAQPLSNESSVLAHFLLVVYAAIFAATAYLAEEARAPVAIVLIGAWLVVGIVLINTDDPSETLRLAGVLITLLVVVLVAWLCFVTLFRETSEGIDALSGAVFGYLLLAMIFSEFYHAIELWSPGAFTLSEDFAVKSELLYFSLVTITTLGYGDILPVQPFARIVAGGEAAFGTLYIAVLIGRIVGALKPTRSRGAASGEAPESER